jgi:hypothetical protein
MLIRSMGPCCRLSHFGNESRNDEFQAEHNDVITLKCEREQHAGSSRPKDLRGLSETAAKQPQV